MVPKENVPIKLLCLLQNNCEGAGIEFLLEGERKFLFYMADCVTSKALPGKPIIARAGD